MISGNNNQSALNYKKVNALSLQLMVKSLDRSGVARIVLCLVTMEITILNVFEACNIHSIEGVF